jgi:hypothetical protein
VLSKRYREYWIVLTWGVVGFGLGLLALSTMLWLRQTGMIGTDDQAQAASAQLAEPLTKLRAGQVPMADPAMAPQWAPLWTALAELQRQRMQALVAYEAQISQAAVSVWMAPEQLIKVEGRAELDKRLALLDNALREWTQSEVSIQNEFDDAFQAWLLQAPAWLPPPARQRMLDASAEATKVLNVYVKTEQALLIQIRHLSEHMASLEGRVSLANASGTPSTSGQPQELMFDKEADLNRYRSSVSRLAELAQQEQSQMARIKQIDEAHLKQLAQTLASVVGVAASR